MLIAVIIALAVGILAGFVLGYTANKDKVQGFIKRHIVDDNPYDHEDHSPTRYAQDYVDWSKVPDWVIWVAIDGYDGKLAYFGDVLPIINEKEDYWMVSTLGVAGWCNGYESVITGPLPPWRESLRKRPNNG